MYYLTESGRKFLSEGQVPSRQFTREAQTRVAMRRLATVDSKRQYYRTAQALKKKEQDAEALRNKDIPK